MDTKTAKLEAMTLLALDELTDEQAARLDWLTMKQAGIYLEDFHKSVDACLALPKPSDARWTLDETGEYWLAGIRRPGQDTQLFSAVTLPIAMLKCWWTLPD